MDNSPTTADLREKVADLSWYHSIDLGGGVVTPGVVKSSQVLPRYEIPEDLSGKSVLDIGAWDGFYSFEAARRGADRVLATDSFSWSGPGWGTKRGFELARDALGFADVVDDQDIDTMDISEDALGSRFDVVFHLGVLYHLRDPITSLERAASVCDELLILETETALNFVPYPAARIYPGRGLYGDPTNWYQFNSKSLIGLLGEFGFPNAEVVYRYPQWRRVGGAVKAKKAGKSFRSAIRSDRVIIHARR